MDLERQVPAAEDGPTVSDGGATALRASGQRRPIDIGQMVRNYGIIVVFLALFVVLCFAAPNFLTKNNILNLLYSNAYIGIAACGVTLLIVAGNFDLSVGACFAMAGIVAAWWAVHIGAPVVGLIVAVVVVGLVVGLANSLLINVIRIHSFLATLASSLVLTGLALAITGGFQIAIPPESTAAFTWIGREKTLLGIPNPVVVFAIVALILGFVLARTRFGRYIYATGGSPEAARLSGVRVGLVMTSTLVICSTCAALAGVIEASVAGAGQSEPGGTATLPLDAIAAVVIGGTSIDGGEGAIWRTVIGVLFIAMIHNAFNLLGIDPSYLPTATGLLIIIAVAANSMIGTRA